MSAQRGGRPSQVTVAGWAAVVGSVLMVLGLFDAVTRLRTVEFRESTEEFLATPPGSGLGLETGQVLEVMRWLMMFSGAAAAAATVLAVYVLQRNRAARVGYTVAAAVVVVTAPVSGYLSAIMAFAAVMLWTRPAREWFSGSSHRAYDQVFGTPSTHRVEGSIVSSEKDASQDEQGSPGVPSGGGAGAPEGAPAAGQSPWPRMPEEQQPGRPLPPPTQGFGSAGGPSYPQGGYPPPAGYPYPGGAPAPGGYPPPGYGPPPAYPSGPYGYGPYAAAPSSARPTTVTVAAWITWVLSTLTVLGLLIMGLVLAVARPQVVDQMQQDPAFQRLELSADQVLGALWVMGGIGLFWSASAVVLAWFAFRRANWARITLVVSAAIALLVSLTAFPVSLLHVLGAGAVIVLLFTGGANEWYDRKPAPAPGYPGYPGAFPPPYGPPHGGAQGGTQGGAQGGFPGGPQTPAPQGRPGEQDRPEGAPDRKDEPPPNVW